MLPRKASNDDVVVGVLTFRYYAQAICEFIIAWCEIFQFCVVVMVVQLGVGTEQLIWGN